MPYAFPSLDTFSFVSVSVTAPAPDYYRKILIIMATTSDCQSSHVGRSGSSIKWRRGGSALLTFTPPSPYTSGEQTPKNTADLPLGSHCSSREIMHAPDYEPQMRSSLMDYILLQ